MFQVGIITDEVSQDLREAAEFARHYGLQAVELRSVEGKGPFEWTDEDARSIDRIIQEYGLKIVCISAPLFKCDLHDEKTIERHIAAFRRVARHCQEWGCGLIRGFDFWDIGASVPERAAQFAPIIEICREHGVTCVVEYDPSVHASTPEKLKALIEAIDSPCIQALFDPGNGIFSRPDAIPYPDDYVLLKPWMAHIHLKDAVSENGVVKAVCIGKGWVNYPSLLAQLIRDHYNGYIMLETHYRMATELTEEQLKLPGGQAFSDGAYAASQESMEALLEIIEQINRED